MSSKVSENIPQKVVVLADISGIGFDVRVRANKALWEALEWEEQWEIKDYYNGMAKRLQHLMRDSEQMLEVKYAEVAQKEHDGASKSGAAGGNEAEKQKKKDAQSEK